jgi:hypothetical protein
MKRLLVVVLFAVLAMPVCADEWVDAFAAEHGYAPDADPGLLALGFTPEEAMAEHLAAREWSLELGHAPDDAEWMARWHNEQCECVLIESDAMCVKGGECQSSNSRCLAWRIAR